MAKGWRGRWLRQWGDDCNAGAQTPVMRHAVVIGADMAGLAAARALAAHVEQVTVLDVPPLPTRRHSTLARRRRFTCRGCWRVGRTLLPGHEAPGETHTLVVDLDVTEMITMFQVKGR